MFIDGNARSPPSRSEERRSTKLFPTQPALRSSERASIVGRRLSIDISPLAG